MVRGVPLPSLEVLGCPSCHAPLAADDRGGDSVGLHGLTCTRDGTRYPVAAGIPRLVKTERADSVRAFAREYSEVWRKDGWGGSDPAYLLALPYRDTSGRGSAKWRAKARSLDTLLPYVDRVGPRTVADLGCGMGWLAYHLARRGLQVYALDAVVDDVLGLQAAGEYLRHGVSFERVQGEITSPPFLNGVLDMVIYNASLHYAPSASDALSEAARILRPGGIAVVMNSPVHEDADSAARAEADFRDHLQGLGASDALVRTYHHFVRRDLVSAIEGQIGPVQELPYDPGIGFRWMRRAKGIALRMELARFPILWARSRGGQSEIYRPSAMGRTA